MGSNIALLALLQAGGTWILFRIFYRFMGITVALTAARFAALAIPFVNVAMTAWLVFDLTGPAYRRIVPSVLNIALLRLSYAESKEAS